MRDPAAEEAFQRGAKAFELTAKKPKPANLALSIVGAYSVAAAQHMKAHGITRRHFAVVAHKNREHAANNPHALLFKQALPSVEAALEAPTLHGPLTFAMTAPLACGAAAAVLVSEAFLTLAQPNTPQLVPVEIVAQAMATDTPASFDHAAAAREGGSVTANLCGFETRLLSTRGTAFKRNTIISYLKPIILLYYNFLLFYYYEAITFL